MSVIVDILFSDISLCWHLLEIEGAARQISNKLEHKAWDDLQIKTFQMELKDHRLQV